MTTFKTAVQNTVNEAPARTANGMKARATTASELLDFFSKVGSARGLDMTQSFDRAMSENLDLAVRTLLWTRDVRGGAGERKQFRDLLQYLEKYDAELAGRLLPKIPEVGRWDDIFAYSTVANRQNAFAFVGEALRRGDGLCAKWMPRKGKEAAELRNFLGMSPKQYRKTIVNLTNVVEQKMCAKEWDKINFSHVPSLASARYQRAFGRNAAAQYEAYLAELQKDPKDRSTKVKINAGAVYPYDVIKSVKSGNAAVANEQWKALPNYMGDASVIPLVDTSGSMSIRVTDTMSAMDIAISLGLYTAEKNTGAFKDVYLTFNSTPRIDVLKGSLYQRYRQMINGYIGSTNLHAAFDAILDMAKKNRVPQSDMPGTLLILSDMQFNACCRYDDTAQQMIRRKYKEAGYDVPKIVYWNLNAGYGSDNNPVRFDENGTAYVSGFSPSIAKAVLTNDMEDYTPYNIMLKTIMDSRYDY